jgi:hypothetical protein
MKKKIEIRGLGVTYETADPDIDAPDIPERYKKEYKEQVNSGFRFYGGPPKKPRRAWRDDLALQKKFREEDQARMDLEQNKKRATERARIGYQASLNVSMLPPGMFESEMPIPAGQIIIIWLVVVGLCLAAALALSYAAHTV